MSLASAGMAEELYLDGRTALRLHAGWGHVSVLTGGGHICEFVSSAHSEINPLWRPPWSTIEPEEYAVATHSSLYGPPPDGRLLSSITGHSLSFDFFGPPSQEETAAGLSTHGEAPAVRWQVHRSTADAIEYGATLPVAGIDFRRTLRLDANNPVFYCEETARNLSRTDRPICWNEHVTLGPPFLECGVTLADMPATQSRVIGAGYTSELGLIPDTEFPWPHAPTPGGGSHDLRTTPDGCYGRYTAQLLDPCLALGYVAAANPRLGLLLLYVFRRADFPWVGNWEERHARSTAPWNSKTFCRGLEFSSTPFAIPRRDTISQGPLFGESTWRWLPALSQLSVRFVAILAEVPHDFTGVSRVLQANGHLTIHEHGSARSFSLPMDTAFLNGTNDRAL